MDLENNLPKNEAIGVECPITATDVLENILELSNGVKVSIVGGAETGSVARAILEHMNAKNIDIASTFESIPRPDADAFVECEPTNNYLDFKYTNPYNFPYFDYLQPIPNKLQLLKDLKLSPEQIDYFKNAPSYRLEGESQKDYKTRRMLNKLIIKYRGLF